MTRNLLFVLLAVTGSACGTTTTSTQTSELDSINSCDDGPAACNGNAQCESCLEEAECASGPDPVWVDGVGCECTDNNPANCVYTYCCALGYAWDPDACDCVHQPDCHNG